MDEIYEHIKTIDYTLLCFLNKYRIIYKYTKLVNDIFLNTINEYNVIINEIQQKYKQHVYNAVNQKYLEHKENNEIQKEQDKKITEIKENLKKASKLTNTSIKINEDGEKKSMELNRELNISFPYSVQALYKLRYYRNMFIKNYSILTKNDNYLNACEQRRKFLEKIKISAVTKRNENVKRTSDIFKDEDKNMIRILNENHFFKESQQLKEILIINKYLNKAKNIINNIPQFLYNIVQEFELTESSFNENMYLFILLALNKWIKKILIECENFITYKKNKAPVKGEVEKDIYKKHSDYINDILQRGVEHTTIQFSEKPFFIYPQTLHFNINTSFLTYYFLYLDKNLLHFLKGYYITNNNAKKKDSFNKKKKIKMVVLNKKEESVYMKNEIYNYNFQDEYEEVKLFDDIGFEINQEQIYPNIFLICNYLLQKETQKLIKEIYRLQKNGFHLMFYQDVSVVIQILINLIKNLKVLFKKDVENENNELKMEEEEEEEENPEKALSKLHKYMSKVNISFNESTNYKKFLGPLRIMILNMLKLIHVLTNQSNKNTVCTFWQKLSIEGDFANENLEEKTEKTEETEETCKKEEKETNGKNKNYNPLNCNPLMNYGNTTFKQLKKECNENICYMIKTKEEPHNVKTHYTYEVNMKDLINKRILCYSFYKIVAYQMEKIKYEIENKKNRDVFTGILKKKKYKLESSKTNKTTGKLLTQEEIKKNVLKSKTPVIPTASTKNSQIQQNKKDLLKEPLKLKTGSSTVNQLKREESKLLKTKKDVSHAKFGEKGNANISKNISGISKNTPAVIGVTKSASNAKKSAENKKEEAQKEQNKKGIGKAIKKTSSSYISTQFKK